MGMEKDTTVDVLKKKFDKFDVIISLFTMQFVWVSKKFADILDYKVDELLGKHVNDVIVFDRLEMIKEIGKVLGRKTDDEKTAIKKGGGKLKIKGEIKYCTLKAEPFLVIRIKDFHK